MKEVFEYASQGTVSSRKIYARLKNFFEKLTWEKSYISLSANFTKLLTNFC